MHDHLADFRRSQFALGSLMHHAFDFVDDGFKLRRRHRPLLASFQQTLQNFLTFEAFSAAILLDHHVRNFVDAFVRGEAPSTFEAFPPAPNGVAAAALSRINYLVVDVRTERALHSAISPRAS